MCKACKDNPNKTCRVCACHICGGKQDPDKQLMCDECDMAFHIYCLQPPLSRIPDEDWWVLGRAGGGTVTSGQGEGGGGTITSGQEQEERAGAWGCPSQQLYRDVWFGFVFGKTSQLFCSSVRAGFKFAQSIS